MLADDPVACNPGLIVLDDGYFELLAVLDHEKPQKVGWESNFLGLVHVREDDALPAIRPKTVVLANAGTQVRTRRGDAQ
jgi:hypothetical protein